jgi:hypothetical protein
LIFAGDPAAQRLEAWADELTAEAARIGMQRSQEM